MEQPDSASSAEQQMVTEVAPTNATSSSTTVNDMAPGKSPTLGAQCSTARGIVGACAPREDCQFSTAAIDLTLFATHSYVKSCSMEEVCCPLDALIQTVTSNQPLQDDNTFDFDEDN